MGSWMNWFRITSLWKKSSYCQLAQKQGWVGSSKAKLGEKALCRNTPDTPMCSATLIPLAVSFLHLFCSVRDSVGLDCWVEANHRSLASFRDLNALDAKASLLGKQLFMTFMHCLLTLGTWCFLLCVGCLMGWFICLLLVCGMFILFICFSPDYLIVTSEVCWEIRCLVGKKNGSWSEAPGFADSRMQILSS